MKKTKRGIAVLLLVSILFSMSITSVFAAENSEQKVYTTGTNTLNLEGKFSANGNKGAVLVKDGAKLTINGTDATELHGTLGEDDYSMAVWAKGEGTKVVINGGYFTNETDGSERGTDLIYASGEAAIEINGGKFKAAVEKWTLNCHDASTTPIIVKGGTFYKFDPSNAQVGEGEIVVPEGYEVVKNGDWYSVYKVSKIYSEGTNTLNLEGEFTANGNKGAVLVKDGAKLTINGTDTTELHGALGEDNYSMAVWAKGEGTKVVINGGYFTNETDGSERGTDLIYASGEAAIEINGGKFKAAVEKWTLNCHDASTTPIIVKGGTFYKFDPSNAQVGEGEIVVPEGYRVVKNGDWYSVYKVNTVTVKDVEGGKVTANPTKAIEGELVTLTVVPDEGYELEKIEITDGGMGDTLIGKTTFKMLVGDTVVTPVFKKLTTEAEVPNNVANAEKVEEMLVETLKENKEFAEIIKDKNVEIKIEVKEKEVTSSEKEAIESAASKEVADIKVANYIDISIYVKDTDNGKNLGNLETVKEAITFTVPVPENLPELAEGFRRIFYIVREHDGDIDILEVKEADGKLSFETDKFSTYAIAYKDVENSGEGEATPQPEQKPEVKPETKPTTPDVPKTGDNVVVYIALALLAITGMGVAIKIRKRK